MSSHCVSHSLLKILSPLTADRRPARKTLSHPLFFYCYTVAIVYVECCHFVNMKNMRWYLICQSQSPPKWQLKFPIMWPFQNKRLWDIDQINPEIDFFGLLLRRCNGDSFYKNEECHTMSNEDSRPSPSLNTIYVAYKRKHITNSYVTGF